MRHFRALVVLLTVCLTLTPLAAVGAADDRDAQIDELLELTGLRRQLAQMPSLFQAVAPQQAQRLSPEDRARLVEALARAFQWETASGPIRDALRAEFDASRVATLLAWLRSPLARRLADLEVAASSAEAQPELARFAAQLQTSRPSPSRLALLQRLDAAAGTGELQVEFVLAMLKAMAETLGASQASANRPRPGEVDALLRQMRPQLEPSLRQAALLSLLFTYRSLTEADLQEYVQFMESEGARWLSGVIRRGLLGVASTAGGNAAAFIAEATREQERRAQEEFRARLTREFLALFERDRALVAKVEAQTRYEQLATESDGVRQQLEALKKRYIVELKKGEHEPFVGVVVKANETLTEMFDAWRAEEMEGAKAEWLQGALEIARQRRARGDSGGSTGEVLQHQSNLQTALRRRAEAHNRRLALWEEGKRLLDEAARVAPGPGRQ